VKAFRKILLSINIIIAILLIFTYLSFEINPEKSILLAFIPFIYTGLLLLNIIFIIIWIIFKWKLSLISISAIIIGIKYFNMIFPLTSYISSSDTGSDFKLMTYNVMAFGLYNWDKNLKSNILNIVNTENPDIVCFQEAYWNNGNKNFMTVDSAKHCLNADYMFKGSMASGVGGQNFGLATISRFPIIRTFSHKFENSSNGYIYTDIAVKSDTFRIYNCHLQSIYLNSDDFSAIKIMFENELNPEMKGVVKKYVKAYQKRAKQAQILRASIDTCKYPVLVCGDLNDSPLTYTYSEITANLKDSYTSKGNFPGYTWDNHKIKQRIDYILFDKKLKCISHKIIKEKYSDHYPVSVEFKIENHE
jgi:endonuclease/exonuclease/phosphatase family metal-dependent hydrolase